MRFSAQLEALLKESGSVMLVTVAEVKGSAPREAGAQMAVARDQRFIGTIGGGSLEWQALAEAQRRLEAGNPPGQLILSLGPDLGQCCGGRVVLRFEPLGRSDLGRIATLVTARPRQPVYLFGAGHVGRALVLALAPLPFDVTWVDPRRQEFPAAFPQGVTAIAPPDVPALVQEAPLGTFLLVMTHSHALDLAIVDAALRRPDLGLVGLIGSSTKRARFLGQLRQAGQSEAAIARLQCPIGVSGLRSKEPAVIAAGVAVQLLQRMEEAAPAQIVRAAANNPVWSNIA